MVKVRQAARHRSMKSFADMQRKMHWTESCRASRLLGIWPRRRMFRRCFWATSSRIPATNVPGHIRLSWRMARCTTLKCECVDVSDAHLSADRWRWCEYIAFRGLWRVAFARLHESDISDTELQVGKFLLPKSGQKVKYESNEELYWHVGEEDVSDISLRG
jgi:hypothetical protein